MNGTAISTDPPAFQLMQPAGTPTATQTFLNPTVTVHQSTGGSSGNTVDGISISIDESATSLDTFSALILFSVGDTFTVNAGYWFKYVFTPDDALLSVLNKTPGSFSTMVGGEVGVISANQVSAIPYGQVVARISWDGIQYMTLEVTLHIGSATYSSASNQLNYATIRTRLGPNVDRQPTDMLLYGVKFPF